MNIQRQQFIANQAAAKFAKMSLADLDNLIEMLQGIREKKVKQEEKKNRD